MSKALLTLIIAIFILLIGGGIWRRTQMAVAPPIYDPIGYYCRVKLVWSALKKGDFHGILNGPMSIRPPGTAFVLYPFGFSDSVQSFLFRSVLMPILIWAMALGIPIATQVRCWQDALLGSALIVGLITMPLFYHFEYNENFAKAYVVANQWGLVDALEGAIAALATSFLRFGINNRNINWCALAWLVGAFSFFIKPSGMLVMMALVVIATVELLLLFLDRLSHRFSVLKFSALVFSTGFFICGAALWLAFNSDYMSREVITQAVKASQILLSFGQGSDTFAMLAMFVVPVIGWWWFCPGILFIALLVCEALKSVANRRWNPTSLRLAAGGMILIAAVCWWMFLAGQQHRYLFPFLLMVIAWLIPEVFRYLLKFRPWAKRAITGYCIAPAILLGGLLWSRQPPVFFQQLMGVNLSAGGYEPEVNQGKWLYAESERVGRPLNLYSVGNYGVGAVEMIDWVKSIERNNSPHRFIVRRPLDWTDTPGLRVEDIVQSDFLLLESVRQGIANDALPVSSWGEEVERFKQFAYSERGVDRSGLQLVSDGTVKILRVADAHKFMETLFSWANSIQWTDGFQERNKAFLERPPK
jgi:hypothetical protein